MGESENVERAVGTAYQLQVASDSEVPAHMSPN